VQTESRDLNSRESRVCSSATHLTDLRDYLTRKRSIHHQITSQCCCKRLIMTVLSNCHYGSQMIKSLVFHQLSAATTSNSAKRRRSRKKSFSDVEFPEVTSNIVGPSTIPSKSKGKQLVLSSEKSDTGRSSGLKELLIEPERIYWRTRIWTRAIAPDRLQLACQRDRGKWWALYHHRVSFIQLLCGDGKPLHIWQTFHKR